MSAYRSGWRAGIAGLLVGLLAASGASGHATGASVPDGDPSRVDARSGPVSPQGVERRVRLADGGSLVLTADGTAVALRTGRSTEQQRTWPLAEVRRNASLTLLPSGRVLIWGGHDAQGRVQAGGLWFDADLRVLEPATDLPLSSRAMHTTTVLTDGQVLFAGGRTEGPVYELWREGATDTVAVPAGSQGLRPGHRAELQADGYVRLYGGSGGAGRRDSGETAFDPAIRSLQRLGRVDVSEPAPGLAASIPAQGAEQVAIASHLALRFAQRVRAGDLNDSSVTLLGPGGQTPIRIVPAENGRLLFVTPLQELFPDTPYTLLVDGAHTVDDAPLPLIALDFRTAALTEEGEEGTGPVEDAAAERANPQTGAHRTYCNDRRTRALPCRDEAVLEEGIWTPGMDNTQERWRVQERQPDLMSAALMARVTEAVGFTTLTGQILRVDGAPVAGVEVSIGTLATHTDAQGRFWLHNAPAGRQEIYVDGTTANAPGVEYGQFVVGAEIEAGTLTQLPYTMYLPRIAGRDKIRIPSPARRDTVLTHPDMPGLEIHLPAGTVIRDRKGRIVRELAVVPTPVNRAPYPLPKNYPMYLTLQPGGAVIQGLDPTAGTGVRVVYPNYDDHRAGTEADFWIYDPAEGWRVYGQGYVQQDGGAFVPEQGVALRDVVGFGVSINTNDAAPEEGMPPDCQECGEENAGSGENATAGDPIDLRTGYFTYQETDIHVADVASVSLARSYRPRDRKRRDFGYGTASNFSYRITAVPSTGHNPIRLVLPNGVPLDFTRTSGSGTSGTWRHYGTTSFSGAVIERVGSLYQLTMRDGSRMGFGAHSPNELRWIEDRFGSRTQLTYDAGLLHRVTSPNGRFIEFDHDGDKRITHARTGLGDEWRYEYNSDGFLSEVIYPDGTRKRYEYTVWTPPPGFSGPGGPSRPPVIANPTPGLFTPYRHQVRAVFDRRDNRVLLNEIELELFGSNNEPVPTGRVVKQTLADGGVYEIDYFHEDGDTTGVLVTHPDGSRRRVVFGDTEDRFPTYPLSDTLAYGTDLEQTFAFERNSLGQMTARIDPLGRRTEYTHNGEWQVTRVKYLAGTDDEISASVSYTPDGQLKTLTDPLGRTTTLDYIDGCLTRITNPLGHRTALTCNAAGQPDSVTDALHNTTQLHYLGPDLAGITDPLGRSMHFRHDALGRAIAAEDDQGNLSRREYDAMGRVTKLVDPSGNETELGYDENGNATAVLMPSGSGITYEYDERDRVVERTDNLGQSEYWTWDTMNRLESYTDRKGQITVFTYDVLGRPETTTYHDGSTVTAHYDEGGRLRSLVDTVSGILSWDYDDLDQVIEAISPQGNIAYEYDDAGRRTAMTAASQARIEYQYDDNDRLRRILQGSEMVEFDYDALDRLEKLTLPNGIETGYAYNDASQLAGMAWHTPDGSLLHDLGYGYDSAGRRVTQTGSLAPQALPAQSAGANAFDDNNRQTQYDGQALTYDLNGNLTGDGARTYVWNARNQLVEIKEGANTIASFGYDAQGRRYTKTEGGATAEYLYDGLNAVQETQEGDVVPVLTGLGIDERIARGSGANRRYFLTDGLGSTRVLTDDSGGVVQSYDYDPYGGTHPANTDVQNPYRYTGREQDANGLYYYRARYYHPGMGRFVSEDPIDLAGGDLNVYAYVGGSPVRFVDPLGLEKLILFRPEASHFYVGAQRHQDIPGIWSVYAHMDPNTVIDQRGSTSVQLDVDGIARALAEAGWKPGDPVDFMGCRSGQGQDSIAEQFAKKYGSPTTGATQFMWYNQNNPNGITGIYGKWPFTGAKNTWMPGHMRSFSPGP